MKKVAAIGILMAMSGCAYIQPFIQDFNIISISDEIALGNKLHLEVQKEMKLVENTQSEYIRSLGAKLVKSLPKQAMPYHFNVVHDKTPNAFTIPGGYIYLHSGLLDFSQNESEIAGVIAHEMGHAYERHPTKSISRAYGAQYLTDLIFHKETSQLKNLAFKLTQGGVLSRYSRQDEAEADEVGFYLLKQSGISPHGLVSFLMKIRNLEGNSLTMPFLSSHPPTSERIQRLEQLEKNPSPPLSPGRQSF